MRALILCAGRGERLRPITEKIAKPAVPVLSVPMWSYPAQLIETLGITELHVNTHYLPETIRASFNEFGHFKYPITFHHEEELQGSGGPLWKLDSRGVDDIVMANGDGLLLSRDFKILNRMLQDHKRSRALATVLCMPFPGVGHDFSGLWIDGGQQIKDIGVNKGPDLTPVHYASVMLLSSKIFNYLPKGPSNIFTEVLLPAQKQHEVVQAYVSEDLIFYETGNPKGLSHAQQELQSMIEARDGRTNLMDVLDRFKPGWRN